MTIETLLNRDDLKAVTEALRQHPFYRSDRQFKEDVMMLTGLLARFTRAQRNGSVTHADASVRSAQISNGLLSLVSEYNLLDYDPDKAVKDTILFLSSNPGDVLQMEKEFTAIHNYLQDKEERFRVVSSKRVTRATVRRELLERKPTIVHFSGHGLGSDNGFRQAGLVFEDENNRKRADVVIPCYTSTFQLLRHC